MNDLTKPGAEKLLKKIRAEYVRGNVSYRILAEKYGVSFSSIRRTAEAQKWTDLRKKAAQKANKKVIETVASQEANRADRILVVADKLLALIEKAVDDGSIVVTARGLRDITGALKDLREIKGIRHPLDVEEQTARIKRIIKDTEEDTGNREITVVIDDSLRDLSV
ncbi:MAG: hypothetical protein J5744_07715 [Oscillospiraceae bacterium]|nr:hypothetical protein [Oscillospiraceae bacterium]